MNEVAVFEQRAPTLTAAQVRGQVQLVQQVMESVMKKDVHYGIIPGTDKPSLLKPGCEVLMTTFRIAVDPIVEDLSTSDEIHYRVRCVGTHQTSGIVMGTGIGECSSNEEKYKWKRSNDREFERTPEDRRRIKYGYDKNKRTEYEVKQIRTEPADVANTILKMAKKRALVDFTLTALAASDCFNQDLEDIPEEIRDNGNEPEKRSVQQPRAKSEQQPEPQSKTEEKADPNQKLKPGQIKVVQKALDRAAEAGSKVSAESFCQHFQITALPELPFVRVNEALKWISEQGGQEEAA
jgi:hypothetical protein